MLFCATGMKMSYLLMPVLWTKTFSPKLPLVTMKPHRQIWYCSVFNGCHSVFGLWKFIMGHGPGDSDLQEQMELHKWNSHLEFTALPGCIVGNSIQCQTKTQNGSLQHDESTRGLENTAYRTQLIHQCNIRDKLLKVLSQYRCIQM